MASSGTCTVTILAVSVILFAAVVGSEARSLLQGKRRKASNLSLADKSQPQSGARSKPAQTHKQCQLLDFSKNILL